MFAIQLDNGAQLAKQFEVAGALVTDEVRVWLRGMAQWTLEDLRQRVPVKTGALKNSLRFDVAENATGGDATFYGNDYGAMLDAGAAPFTIQAKGGKPMVFVRGGDKIFAMSVNHPGYKAREFTLQTLTSAEPEADRLADEVADRIWKAVIG